MGRKPEGKAEKAFKRFGKKVDAMIADLEGLKEKARENYKDQFNEFDRNKETLKTEFKNFKENHKDRWEDVEERLENAGVELKEAFKSAFGKKSND